MEDDRAAGEVCEVKERNMSDSTSGAASVVVGPIRPSTGVSLLPGLSTVVGAGLVTWWAIGNQDTGEDHLVGPFNLPAWVEPTVDAFGLGLLVLAFAAVWVPSLRRGPRLAAASVVLLALNAAFLAAAWPIATAVRTDRVDDCPPSPRCAAVS